MLRSIIGYCSMMGISTLYGHQVFKSFEILKINLIVPTKMKKEKR
jgi:hypothetical protein